MVKVAIIGATGYTARESIQLLLNHPEAEITNLTTMREEGTPLTDVFPCFQGRLEMMIEPADLDKLATESDVALCCLPHKMAMDFVPKLLSTGMKVVDFSADYRIRDVDVYEAVYQVEHTDKENVATAAFGLPELFRESLAGANLIANPGCYPTAATLGLAPLLKEKIIAFDDIAVNAVSGVSGAGRKPSQAFHFPEMNDNLFAYAVGTHRHMPEMEQILKDYTGNKVSLLFQPHVGCFDRGIAETIYCQPLTKVTEKELMDIYQAYYGNEPFIRLRKKPPTVKDLAFTNFCDIFATVAKGKVIVFSAIDNLIKGAAGQAVQNMNIICGLEETRGLI